MFNCQAQQRAIATTNIHKVIICSKRNLLYDALAYQTCNSLLSSATEGEIVYRAEMQRCVSAVFYVAVGMNHHWHSIGMIVFVMPPHR